MHVQYAHSCSGKLVKVPVLVLSVVAMSFVSPLTPGTEMGPGKGPEELPVGATALGGRFPGTFTVTRRRSISFP